MESQIIGLVVNKCNLRAAFELVENILFELERSVCHFCNGSRNSDFTVSTNLQILEFVTTGIGKRKILKRSWIRMPIRNSGGKLPGKRKATGLFSRCI